MSLFRLSFLFLNSEDESTHPNIIYKKLNGDLPCDAHRKMQVEREPEREYKKMARKHI